MKMLFGHQTLEIVMNKYAMWKQIFGYNKKLPTNFNAIFEKQNSKEKNIFPNKIHSDRLVIRVITRDYSSLIHEAICSSYEDLKNWVAWAKYMTDRSNCEKWCSEAYEKYLNRE